MFTVKLSFNSVFAWKFPHKLPQVVSVSFPLGGPVFVLPLVVYVAGANSKSSGHADPPLPL